MTKLKAETAYLLDAAFGPELPADLAAEWSEKLGYHKARSMVLVFGFPKDITPDTVKLFIRDCLAGGLGELPVGWTCGPTEAGDGLELTVWTLKPDAST